jgi:hypothetical protein
MQEKNIARKGILFGKKMHVKNVFQNEYETEQKEWSLWVKKKKIIIEREHRHEYFL